MLESLELQELARAVFAKQLPDVELEDLSAEAFIGSEGYEMLRVKLLFEPQEVEAITGDDALSLLLALNDALQGAGEGRFASIEYATTDDLPFDEE
jgi:hypothetical protein